MTRKSKKYQLPIITLLLCFLQVAGIDVYAQATCDSGTERQYYSEPGSTESTCTKAPGSCSGDRIR